MSNSTAHRGNIVARVLDWLRAGYPDGVPQTDYVALMGLLHRRLTEQEVELVATTLASEGKIDATDEDVRAAVRASIHETPDEVDINRVRSRLAHGGWPLADPSELLGAGTDGETA